MKIGDLRHRVTIKSQPAQKTDDSFGQDTTAWATLATVWAQVYSTGGTENVDKQQWRAVTTYQVRIRRRTDVRTTMRVVYGAKTLEIVSIAEANIPSDMVLVCQEVI